MNEIRNVEKNMSNEIFKEDFGFKNPSFLVKKLLKKNQIKNNQIIYQVVCSMN